MMIVVFPMKKLLNISVRSPADAKCGSILAKDGRLPLTTTHRFWPNMKSYIQSSNEVLQY